ncbi:RND efflux system outer membrane lipoprotein [Caballeronia sordidicola]|uniref:RND efflux system outer membrane lipoprotein n=1 Tax=Caballeronia sordidicola TaxID=196367 RepID=A0A158I769_CABSO|nr:efflux transporter outer membrane subunit [Caballeronia sordidicola]SAL52213.1 RND efflux system outer membrane lipoprotein [Caballeronia sordidicola]
MKNWAILGALLVLSGCGSTLPRQTSGVVPPDAWRYASGPVHRDQVKADWWRSFGNPELDTLVTRAAAGSFHVAAAIARVEQARASARIAGAALLPTVTGFADASRQGGLLVNNTGQQGTGFDPGLAASFELDFWGRNRALRDAASANLRASVFDRDTVVLSVTSDVANTWLQTVALRERGTIAQQNLTAAQRVLAIIESQFRAGAATPLDLAQQRGLVATQRRNVALLHQAANDSEATLAVLLGVPPSGFELATTPLDDLQIPRIDAGVPSIDAGVPSALLTRRPDIAAAEAQLEAANANVAAARAAMLPSVTLTGSIGSGSDRLSGLFDHSLYGIAAGLAAPVFNAGSLAAGRDLAIGQKDELLARYRQAIVASFADVERALNAVAGANAQRAAQDEALAEARRAFALAQSRYRAGSETLLVVLNAQQTIYAAEDDAVQVRLGQLQAAVSLYRTLGGGWRDGDGVDAAHGVSQISRR